jgi:hypothetical protein
VNSDLTEVNSNPKEISGVPNTEFFKEYMTYDDAQADCVSRATEKGAGWTGGLASLSNRADRDAVALAAKAFFAEGEQFQKYWLGFKGVNGS